HLGRGDDRRQGVRVLPDRAGERLRQQQADLRRDGVDGQADARELATDPHRRRPESLPASVRWYAGYLALPAAVRGFLAGSASKRSRTRVGDVRWITRRPRPTSGSGPGHGWPTTRTRRHGTNWKPCSRAATPPRTTCETDSPARSNSAPPDCVDRC